MKKTVALILAVLMAFSLASCYRFTKPAEQAVGHDNQTDAPQTVTENDSSEKDPAKDDKLADKTDEKTAEIIYNGRVDLNFIEVSFGEGEYAIMQLSEELKESFDSLEIDEGAKVGVTYTEKDGIKVITEIKQ